MKTTGDVVAVEATIARQEWTAAFGDAMTQVADCFPRRDSRLPAREAVQAMLMELERRNRWSLAEALGHGGPHRLQHFLSRGVWDPDLAQDRLAAWEAGELTDREVVLVVDETGDAKSSTDCVGAAHQYSGALGGIGLCQVAAHLRWRFRRLLDLVRGGEQAWSFNENQPVVRRAFDVLEGQWAAELPQVEKHALALRERRGHTAMADFLADHTEYCARQAPAVLDHLVAELSGCEASRHTGEALTSRCDVRMLPA